MSLDTDISKDVDAEIRSQIENRVFPIVLEPEEWQGGDEYWLLGIRTKSESNAARPLSGFMQTTSEKVFSIRLDIANFVGQEILASASDNEELH